MPKKSKGQKFIFKVNDKKITDYMFELTRTVIFVFAFMATISPHFGLYIKLDIRILSSL